MSHVLTTAPDAFVPIGTNAAIEQRFIAMADPHRPRMPQLLIVAADLDPAQIGAYGGEAAQTPHLDLLAKSGARFTKVASSRGSPPMSRALEPLDEQGYDTGRFTDADRAVAFIGLRRKASWAAYVELAAADADEGVGTLLAAVRRGGQYRRTLVFVLGAQASVTPAILAWPGQVPPRQRVDAPITCADWLPTLLETAYPGASRRLEHRGVDLTGYVFDGADLPVQTVAAVGARAA